MHTTSCLARYPKLAGADIQAEENCFLFFPLLESECHDRKYPAPGQIASIWACS